MSSSRGQDRSFDQSTPIDNDSNRTSRRVQRLRRALKRRQAGLDLVLENVHDPHNVSAVLRTADAVGVDRVHLLYYREQFPSIGQQSSSGSRKWVERVKHDSVEECIGTLRTAGIKVLAASASGEQSLYETNLTKPVAVLFGNEHRGVSEEAMECADETFHIPMMGLVESLNISVACAVTLYEALRQRIAAGLYDHPTLPTEELERRLTEWIKR
jgi:tRNA (guanosine-2'-O-)-methyltransferase